MDLLRKALRDVEAAVKPRASAARSDPNDLAGTQVVVAGRTFRVGAMFAEGGAARVYRCSSVPGGPGTRDDGGDGTVHPPSSAPLALKQCLLPPELSDAEARHEGDVHASVSAHDDVVTLHAHDVLVPPNRRDEERRNARATAPPRAALLVMDLGEESLAERARRLGGFPEADALRACACVARAVAHMHARDPPVVHMDVKPENVLLFSPPRGEGAAPSWRLCDFGSSALGGERVFSTPRERSRAESSFARTTTPTYRAPEMWDVHRPLFAARGVGRPADVWALGCLLFELLENRPPFGAEPKLAALQGRFEWSPTVVATTNPATRALARSMLAVDPASRPSAEDVSARCAALADVADARRDGDDAATNGDGGVGDDIFENDGSGSGSGSAEEKEEVTPKHDVPEDKRDVPEHEEPEEPEEPGTGWASFDAETPAENAAPREKKSPELRWAAFGDEGRKAPGGNKKAGDDDDDDDDVRESTGEPTTGWATFS